MVLSRGGSVVVGGGGGKSLWRIMSVLKKNESLHRERKISISLAVSRSVDISTGRILNIFQDIFKFSTVH